MMKSLADFIHSVEDPAFTREDAERMMGERIAEMVSLLHMDPAEARQRTLNNLGYMAAYYTEATRERVYDLFGTAHPTFGREWPEPAEALRQMFDMAHKAKEERARKLKENV